MCDERENDEDEDEEEVDFTLFISRKEFAGVVFNRSRHAEKREKEKERRVPDSLLHIRSARFSELSAGVLSPSHQNTG